MPDADHYRKLENLMHSAPIVRLVGACVTIGEGTAEITLPVRGDLFHAAGALHGAMYFLALDNAAFFAVNSLVEDAFVLTMSFNVYLLRPVSRGAVRAAGRVVECMKNQWLAESVLVDSDERVVARGSGIFVKSRIPLNEDIGYRTEP
ncbi:MAG: PaaI family thioesterase [Spirochaetes bacterium]|nr:PaaI family thioesterase [Spirochaetota bacterium]